MTEDERREFIRKTIYEGSSFTVVGIEDQVEKISARWEEDLRRESENVG
jgi:hypothetical protein